jgi:cytochrome c peroxidase
MHDGSMKTLEEVIDFYSRGGRNVQSGPFRGDGKSNPFKSGFVSGFSLSETERTDLVNFLKSLTDQLESREFVTGNEPSIAT